MTIEGTSASQLKIDYMNLLVTQLKTQDPLDPMNNEDMTAQLATLSQLEQTEQLNSNVKKLNSSFEGALIMANFNYARGYLGKEVSFYNETYQRNLTGKVNSIQFVNGEPVLDVAVTAGPWQDGGSKDFMIGLNEINSVSQTQTGTD